jgi:hypothetical protein
LLLLKISLVSIVVGLIAISGRFWGAQVAGLLSGLPVIGGPILWFIYQEQGVEFARSTAAATIGGLAALSSFCFAYSWICRRCGWMLAYGLCCVIFLLIAFFTRFLEISLDLNLHQITWLTLAVVLIQLMLFPVLSKQSLSAPADTAEIIFRMAFAFLLVLGITKFAEILGPVYSGILTVFPIAGSAIAVFSHRNHSAAHAAQSLKSMMFGLLSMLAFFYVLAFSNASFTVSLSIAIGAALLVQALVMLIRRVSLNNFCQSKSANP